LADPLAIHCRPHWPGRPDRSIRGELGETLFDALKRAGQPIASSCTAEAVCGKCIVAVLEGAGQLSQPSGEEREVLKRENASESERLACRTRLLGEGVVVTASYW